MPLYTSDTSAVGTISPDTFAKAYQTCNVVSTESVSSFLQKVRDNLDGVSTSIANLTGTAEYDRMVQEALSSRYSAVHAAKTANMQHFRHLTVSKPDGFSGLYVPYLKDLYLAAHSVTDAAHSALDRLQMGVASFINEYTDDKEDRFYGGHYFSGYERTVEVAKKSISGYFKAGTGKVRTTPDKLLRSLSDVPLVYEGVQTLAALLNVSELERIQAQVAKTTELIDTLLTHNLQSGVLAKSSETKREMVQAIHTTAQVVEYANALYAHFMLSCQSIKDLSEELVKHAQDQGQTQPA